MKKLTIEFVKNSFEKEGYTLLSEVYVNNTISLDYICPSGDKGIIKWKDWRQGNRCAKCAGLKKLTIEFVREQFEKEGYVLLSNVYVNARELLKYICPKGDYGTITWDCWQRGHRCRKCSVIKNSNKSRYTIEFVQEQFKKEGYVLLTEKYTNSIQKLDYTCINGHTHSINWNSWQQGHRCPECNRLKMLGKNNHKWKAELTEKDRIKDRSYPEYKEWRTAVYKRDNYACQCCGKRGVKLNAHHIESYNNNLGLRTVLDNGACLCKKCHKNFHHQYGRGNNTKEQFIEFKSNYKKSQG